jgi:hypothetical protein
MWVWVVVVTEIGGEAIRSGALEIMRESRGGHRAPPRSCSSAASRGTVRLVKPPHQVRTRHDEWSKRALSLWLTALGDVELDVRIAGQSRRGDVLYTERRAVPAHRKRLGALGKLARGRVLFEISRNPFTHVELKSCVLKAVELEAKEARAARRAGRKRSQVVAPALCAITPSMSVPFAAQAGATPVSSGMEGQYTLAPMWGTMIVVVDELPRDRSTLWLRLLGRDEVQSEAVQELLDMSEQEPLRDATMALLVAWQQSLPPSVQQSEDEREMTMNLERVYERWERKTLAKGRAEGKAEGKVEGKAEGKVEGKAEGKVEGKAETLLEVLDARGLTVTSAQRKQVLACTDAARLDAWARKAVTTPSVAALLSGDALPRSRAKRSRTAA